MTAAGSVRAALALGTVLSLAPAMSSAQNASTAAEHHSHQAQEDAGHGHSQPQAVDEQEEPQPTPPATHESHRPDQQAPYPRGTPPPAGLPPITDDDRAAAFPELNGQHTVHDDTIQYFVLFDQLEWQAARGSTAGSWDNTTWVGRDVNRLWLRTAGEAEDGRIAEAHAHVLYGRAIHRWWDLVAGVRQDFRPGPARTWAAIGIQGLAPYFFEVEATAYIGDAGRTHFRFETEYDVLLTNRLILQPVAGFELYGRSDPGRGIGAGLSSAEAGLRLRYEFRRELAPYLGVTWNRRFFGTADLARAAGENTSDARFAMGLRVWF